MEEEDKLLFGSDSEDEGEGKKAQVQEGATDGKERDPQKQIEREKDENDTAGDADPGQVEEEEGRKEERRVEDLFGSDSEDSESGADKKKGKTENGNDNENENENEGEERAAAAEEVEDEPHELYEFNLAKDHTLGSLNAKRDELYLTKFINNVEPEEFDPESFDPRYSQGLGEEQLTVRWRKTSKKGGKEQKGNVSELEAALGMESNARVVKWSDGSMTLQVGDEHIELLNRDITVGTSLVCCKHGRTDKHKLFLESQEVLSKRITFRPFSIKSKAHSLLSKEAVKSKVKSNKSKKITVKENPALMQLEREKEEEAKIKQQEQMQRKQEKVMAKYGYTSFDNNHPDGERDLSVRYLEEGMDLDEEWDEDATRRAREALAGTRSSARTRQRENDMEIDHRKEGGEEEQTAKRQMFSRGLDESDEDEEDENEEANRGQEKNPSHFRGKAVLMSDDDDDGD